MNILITGSNGQLGSEMRVLSEQHPGHRYFFTDIAELDITDKASVLAFIKHHGIDAVVNCAAYTNVDRAEEDEQTAYLINALAPQNLGEAAAETGATLIHISTDYVFDGNASTPYREQDAPCPATAYGRTKLAGEQLLLQACPSAVIIRTAWLYSSFGNNFVKTMLRLGRERQQLSVVFDQIGTPTYAADLAQAIMQIVESKETKEERQETKEEREKIKEEKTKDKSLITEHNRLSSLSEAVFERSDLSSQEHNRLSSLSEAVFERSNLSSQEHNRLSSLSEAVFERSDLSSQEHNQLSSLSEAVFERSDLSTDNIYHFSNEGVCSWYDFTKEIFRQAGITCEVLPIRSEQYPAKTPRPHYSVLDKQKIKDTFSVKVPYWTDSLGRCLKLLQEEQKQ